MTPYENVMCSTILIIVLVAQACFGQQGERIKLIDCAIKAGKLVEPVEDNTGQVDKKIADKLVSSLIPKQIDQVFKSVLFRNANMGNVKTALGNNCYLGIFLRPLLSVGGFSSSVASVKGSHNRPMFFPRPGSQRRSCLSRVMGGKPQDFSVVTSERGSEGRELPIFTSFPSAVQLASDRNISVVRADCPNIPGCFMLHNVLSAHECDQIIRVSEAMGYTDDAPVSIGAVQAWMLRTLASTLGVSLRDLQRRNQNCVWIADETLNSLIFERCRGQLPAEVRGGEVMGLNRRWRLYKYIPGDIFKPHTDGSWPGSGLDSQGKLVDDMWGDRLSQLTWLLYLNDDFEGGETRFFLPNEKKPDEEEGRTIEEVRPKKGSVVCFFHGDHPLSHLHEGGLVQSGTKYVVRSDVLYKLPMPTPTRWLP